MATPRRLFAAMVLLCVLASASTSMALLNRTFVSAQRGYDASPCTPNSPCRTFTAALAAASAGGEVTVLDSGGYGPFTINKSIQILAPPGVYAGLVTTASAGITVTASATDVVVIRGLTINGMNPDGTNSGHFGIAVQSVGKLYIENCVITGGSTGIHYSPAYGAGHTGLFTVKDSFIRNATNDGIALLSSGTARVALDHLRLEGNGNGLNDAGSARATIRDSVLTGNSTGAFADGPGRALTVENCAVVNNDTGIQTDGGATIFVSSTLIHGNLTGVDSSEGPIISYGNNRHKGGNTTDGAFSGSQPLD